MTKRNLLIGSLLCLIAAISWGAMFPVAERAFQSLHPYYFSVIRYSAVSLILIPILWLKEGRQAFRLEGRGKLVLFYGTMAFTVYNLLIFQGQEMMGSPGTVAASIMESLMPMISVILLWIVLKNRPSHSTMLTVILALIGALLVITKGDFAFFSTAGRQLFPLFLIFAGVVGWVIYSIGGGRFQDWSPLRYSTLTCIWGTAVSFVITLIGSAFGWIPVPSLNDVFAARYEMAFMIIFPGLIALLGWNAGIKKISAVNGILFINFVPITTFVLMVFAGYEISIFEVIGTALIIIALVWNSMVQRKAPQAADRRPAKHTSHVPAREATMNS